MSVYVAGGGECVEVASVASGYRFADGPAMLAPPVVWPERAGMRGLYEVFIVDPEKTGEELVFVDQVVANDELSARLKAWTRGQQDDVGLRQSDPDDLDFIVRFVGNVRAKAKE